MRRGILWGLAALLRVSSAWGAEYGIEPGSTSIGFAVDVVDAFTVAGQFGQFSGSLALDLAHPEASTVEVTVETGSFDIGWEPAYSLLRSDAYLDVLRWPKMQFVTRKIERRDERQVRMEGDLTIRGVTRPVVLDAVLEERRPAPDGAGELAEFRVSGLVHRSEFGMQSDPLLVSDEVHLDIRAKLKLQGEGAAP